MNKLIELAGVSKTYTLGGEAVHALNQVDLVVAAGAFVAIMGPSGSGKSTLANVIGGLDQPDAGKVLVDGRDIAELNDKQLSGYRNKYVGFVFQSFNLQGHLTAVENVALPLMLGGMGLRARTARARECLMQVGLDDRLNHMPHQLSGGQRQRVAIARALANKPELIIADEPTGNLDSAKGQEILHILKTLNKAGVTLLVVTHDSAVAEQADRVITLYDGRINEHKGGRAPKIDMPVVEGVLP